MMKADKNIYATFFYLIKGETPTYVKHSITYSIAHNFITIRRKIFIITIKRKEKKGGGVGSE